MTIVMPRGRGGGFSLRDVDLDEGKFGAETRAEAVSDEEEAVFRGEDGGGEGFGGGECDQIWVEFGRGRRGGKVEFLERGGWRGVGRVG